MVGVAVSSFSHCSKLLRRKVGALSMYTHQLVSLIGHSEASVFVSGTMRDMVTGRHHVVWCGRVQWAARSADKLGVTWGESMSSLRIAWSHHLLTVDRADAFLIARTNQDPRRDTTFDPAFAVVLLAHGQPQGAPPALQTTFDALPFHAITSHLPLPANRAALRQVRRSTHSATNAVSRTQHRVHTCLMRFLHEIQERQTHMLHAGGADWQVGPDGSIAPGAVSEFRAWHAFCLVFQYAQMPAQSGVPLFPVPRVVRVFRTAGHPDSPTPALGKGFRIEVLYDHDWFRGHMLSSTNSSTVASAVGVICRAIDQWPKDPFHWVTPVPTLLMEQAFQRFVPSWRADKLRVGFQDVYMDAGVPADIVNPGFPPQLAAAGTGPTFPFTTSDMQRVRRDVALVE